MDSAPFAASPRKVAGVVRTHKYEILSCERCEINGGDGRRVRFAAPRQFHGDRFMARRWKNGLAYVWHDRAANRIGVFEQIGPKTHVELPPETVPGLTVTHALDPL